MLHDMAIMSIEIIKKLKLIGLIIFTKSTQRAHKEHVQRALESCHKQSKSRLCQYDSTLNESSTVSSTARVYGRHHPQYGAPEYLHRAHRNPLSTEKGGQIRVDQLTCYRLTNNECHSTMPTNLSKDLPKNLLERYIGSIDQ